MKNLTNTKTTIMNMAFDSHAIIGRGIDCDGIIWADFSPGKIVPKKGNYLQM